jgi:hypothetical protein
LSAPPDALDLSLNEVEVLAQKATRGAGLPWGVAEDTGRAAAWIAARIGPWATDLLALLALLAAENSTLLLAGLLADDFSDRHIARVILPLWALPGLLTTTARPVMIRLDGAEIRCNPGEAPTATTLDMPATSAVTISFAAEPLPDLLQILVPKFRRSIVAQGDWQKLQALAYRTYVPATDHSRRSGAGAGLLDDE